MLERTGLRNLQAKRLDHSFIILDQTSNKHNFRRFRVAYCTITDVSNKVQKWINELFVLIAVGSVQPLVGQANQNAS
jgi:hypothetical protein